MLRTLADQLLTSDGEPPDIQGLIDALVTGEGDWDHAPADGLDLANRAGGSAGRQAGTVDTDEEGYIRGRAAEFATPQDLNNYRRTGSLATGDPGVGAWGDFTAGDQPFVAVPRDLVRKVHGSEAAGRGKRVQVIAPNGQTAIIPIGDIGPALRNRANNAVIELNPAAKRLLGTGDAEGYRYKFID